MSKPVIFLLGRDSLWQDNIKNLLNKYYLFYCCKPEVEEVLQKTKELKPDVLLVDISGEQWEQIEQLAKAFNEKYKTPAILLGRRLDTDYAELLLEYKPWAYLPKDTTDTQIRLSIEIVLNLRKELYDTSPFVQAADFSKTTETLDKTDRCMELSGKREQGNNGLQDGRRMEIVNNRFLTQYWILEEETP